jgi:hypothetical protein
LALYETVAKKRQVAAVVAGNEARHSEMPVNPRLKELETPKQSTAQTAEMLNVSTRTVATAKKVIKEAIPEIVAIG